MLLLSFKRLWIKLFLLTIFATVTLFSKATIVEGIGLGNIPRETVSKAMTGGLNNEFGWTAKYDIEFKNGEFIITLKIQLTGVDPGADLRNIWESGIENIWSNRFCIEKDNEFEYSVKFDVQFVSTGAHHVVTLYDCPDCNTDPTQCRGSMLAWYIRNWTCRPQDKQDELAAHESGHMFSNFDEYPGGAVNPDGSFGDVYDSIMGGGLTQVYPRHYQFIVDWVSNKAPGQTFEIRDCSLTTTTTTTTTSSTTTTTCPAAQISCGQMINGALSTSDCRSTAKGSSYYADRHSFSASAGQGVAILLTSSFDTYLYLIGPNGSVITYDDDGGGGTNSRIPPGNGFYSLSSSGIYIIEVTSYNSNTTGSYTLNLSCQVSTTSTTTTTRTTTTTSTTTTTLAVHTEPWTTAGSTGTVDDSDVYIAVFSGPTVTVSDSVATSTLDMRYNIVPIDGLLNSSGAIRLKVRYRDNGGSAQVIVKLVRLNPLTAATATMMTFDSNAFPASSSFQTRSINNCPSSISFDFFTRVYYIEVALKKYSSTGAPGLSGIALDFTNCP